MWLKISSAQIVWVCNSNVTTFRTSRKGINFNFSLYTVPTEMLYLQKYLTNFQKLSFGWKMSKVAIVVTNINCTDVLVCNNNDTTLSTTRKCINFNFSLYTVPAEMLYLQKYLTNFQKLFLPERWGRWLLWLKISIAQIFWFCNSNVTTFPTSRKCKIFNISLYTVRAEMLYIQKYLMNFQTLSFGWKMSKMAIVVENINCTDILVLQ